MFKKRILDTINKYSMIDKNDKQILVAVSGGFDSTCLLYVLNELKEELNIEIIALHVNHCIRDNAILDEEYVINTCEKLGIKCFVERIDIKEVASNDKMSIEMAGRKARYEILDKIAKENGCTKIATAHNANDNAETILLNIFRGTGLNGLKGIKKVRQNTYIRPIIEVTRDEINEYLKQNGIEPRLDESNLENEYRRNKIRNELIPYVKENFNSNIVSTLNKMSDIISEEDEYIDKNVEKIYKLHIINENKNNIIINGKKILQYDKNIQKRLILKCIEKLNGTTIHIEEINILDILKIVNNNIGNKYIIPTKGLKVLYNKGQLHFIKC